jgi:hypothetical protein
MTDLRVRLGRQLPSFPRVLALLLVLAGGLRIPLAAAPPQPAKLVPDSPAYQEFKRLVQEYVKKQSPATRLRSTKNRKEIEERQRARAQRIRETRATAKPGDMFTPEISEEFKRAIRETMQGKNAPNVKKTIKQGEPLPSWKLEVNGDYPEHLPLTTVPPTLLLRLPQLPPQVAYRIVGRALVLQDTEARVIIDFIPDALP